MPAGGECFQVSDWILYRTGGYDGVYICFGGGGCSAEWMDSR